MIASNGEKSPCGGVPWEPPASERPSEEPDTGVHCWERARLAMVCPVERLSEASLGQLPDSPRRALRGEKGELTELWRAAEWERVPTLEESPGLPSEEL
jgi:hypothetical protein